MSGAVTPVGPRGSYDHARRRRAQRKGREQGCTLYIPAEELAKAGFEPGGELPFYRVWGSPRGGMFKLYKDG